MIWKKDVECLDLAGLKALQSHHLKKLIPYICRNCPVYKQKIDAAGVNPDAIQSIDDIKRLPFTTKEDMRDYYPYGLFSAPQDQIHEIHVSSGTTGNPTLVGYTKDDLKLWGDVMARVLCCAGAEPGDTIQIAYGYGLFTGGLGFHYGALEMGLRIIPTSSGQTARQLKIMQDFKPRILGCTPSYALYMAEEAKELGIDPTQGNWKIGIFGAEPWSESMRREIEAAWNMLATDVYGLSEIIGPGVAQECQHKDGLHIFSDVFYPEVIDPATGEEVPEGQDGELTITTLTKQGIPLIRYRTRDIVSIRYDKCRCGRTSPRISKIKGRTDDMIVVRGINVFPSQIEHVLVGIEGTQPHYQIVVDRKARQLDEVEVLVEVEQRFFSDEIRHLSELRERIRKEIQNVLSIGVKVTLVEPKTIERSMGKSQRIVDKRTL
ncbi:MAG: phenylacetate--CoA ligase [Sedimentisphaerales bacterium]|jgi:phenylacetate-CoA ligase|nr:phenylacetate--CoA ligase [Sedimentisphaerales bacterium]HNY79531.1 phenylacetate--CoA ligase [Sedimentisphaerales bacterium]HOC62337.1 phenylacetate--CoA ligase [Sedimentisphaerales bacterium]HOH65513.1 phenylacetate--CoA ligase [Sedimentisphaerales bacterium]HQA89818.1 phenylacetate--CoA ligase [Sedimentisphaerales bacterium]